MASKYLRVLEYPGIDSINIKDEKTFRKIIVWLEQNKIKKATPKISSRLNDINSNVWRTAFNEYARGLNCPKFNTDEERLTFISGYAVQCLYRDKKNIYNKHSIQEDSKPLKNVPNVTAENPLDNLDFHSEESKEKINKLAKILDITPHPDPAITIKAIRHIITERFSEKALQNIGQFTVKGTPFPLHDADLGIDLGDPVLKHAAKILRMLYIQDLRNLQTKANELIAKTQNVTANPKTDTKLGKVGF